jgi:hypothetical protein
LSGKCFSVCGIEHTEQGCYYPGMLVPDVKAYVRKICDRPENIFGPAFYERHLDEVAGWALKLAEHLHADREIVELASYFHDISAVLEPATLPRHPVASAELAMDFLRKTGYSQANLEKVAGAIRLHSDPLLGGSAEAVCVSNADAMARIAQPAYWLWFAFVVRRLSFDEGRRWLRELIERQWALMIVPARQLVANEYRLLSHLLSESRPISEP